MKTYKYKIYNQSNTIRLGNLLDDMWQVHKYFHEWQRQRYTDGLPFYRKVSNQRKDFHWKLATYLCKRFDTISIETLNLDGMKRLWGRKVSDLAFYQFVEILKYKCQKHKRHLKQVGQWTPTTKPCSSCGFHNENLTLSDRQWICSECGSYHDRDINAAVNILWAGIAVA